MPNNSCAAKDEFAWAGRLKDLEPAGKRLCKALSDLAPAKLMLKEA